MIRSILFFFITLTSIASAQNNYRSPYSVNYSFKDEELVGDLLKGRRADSKNHASIPFRDWYDASTQKRWGYWGPAAKHFDPPSRLSSKSPQWRRERVIAAGMQFIGYSYQHHHVPDWEPPADWPSAPKQEEPVKKGVDCSNFTAFAYNLALGIKPTGDVKKQSAMTEVTGPGSKRTLPVQRIELPEKFEDFKSELLSGDLLFIKNRSGNLSHVVLWVGELGKTPDGNLLILDSTGSGAIDAKGNKIPNGIHLRPFTERSWYFKQASHVLRIIPKD